MDPLIILFFGILVLLNYIVWFKPSIWIKYMRLGENAPLERIPSQKNIWKFINSPNYIWYIRGVFTLALIITLAIFIFWF
jgi:hypothetical protein